VTPLIRILRRPAGATPSPARLLPALACLLLAACVATPPTAPELATPASLTPGAKSYRDLLQLPEPRGKIVAAVYGIRDQTGQYKPAPDSSFSTAVTQGATSLLIKALQDSNWFVTVERENLQNLLTERKIIRALETPQDKAQVQLPTLLPATVIIEGGIVAYESNVRTGGAGARYLGIGASTLYRQDQVTITLRTVDIRSGQILNTVSTSKTIFSHQLDTGVFRFVGFKELLELEAGYTRNEPAQLCVKEAVEAAVVHLIVQGIKARQWALKDDSDVNAPVVRDYVRAYDDLPVLGSAAAPADPAARTW
jgi:curli production assembly/transport component CsgG